MKATKNEEKNPLSLQKEKQKYYVESDFFQNHIKIKTECRVYI